MPAGHAHIPSDVTNAGKPPFSRRSQVCFADALSRQTVERVRSNQRHAGVAHCARMRAGKQSGHPPLLDAGPPRAFQTIGPCVAVAAYDRRGLLFPCRHAGVRCAAPETARSRLFSVSASSVCTPRNLVALGIRERRRRLTSYAGSGTSGPLIETLPSSPLPMRVDPGWGPAARRFGGISIGPVGMLLGRAGPADGLTGLRIMFISILVIPFRDIQSSPARSPSRARYRAITPSDRTRRGARQLRVPLLLPRSRGHAPCSPRDVRAVHDRWRQQCRAARAGRHHHSDRRRASASDP